MANVYFTKLENAPLFSSKEISLINLDLELTERCNNACIHCYINQPQTDQVIKDREMDTLFVKAVLKEAADLGCLSVRFTGGEPLLREDFCEIYVFARRLGLQVEIFTNATLISTQHCQLFQNIPPGKPLSVSVYGMHSQSYDAVVAREGAFNEFWQGVSFLREYNIPFTVKTSLLPQNKHELAEFEAFAASLPKMEHQPIYMMNFDLRARRDNPSKNRFIKSLRFSPQETLKMFTRDPEKYFNSMRQFAKTFMSQPDDRLFRCGAGLGACVDAYGNVQMCLLLRHPETIYPLDPRQHHQSHPETDLTPLAYALKVFFPKIRRMHATNPEYLKRCAKCFLSGLCEQCPAKSWEEHGTLDTPVEYLCKITHVQAKYLGLLQSEEKAWEIPQKIWQTRLEAFIQEKTAISE